MGSEYLLRKGSKTIQLDRDKEEIGMGELNGGN